MRLRIEAAAWSQEQVRNLRHLGMQVTDKDVARVLVELHNRGLFSAGLVMVGTLAFMSWLNEFGVKAIVSHTQDVDLARRQRLKLARPISFMEAMKATKLGFSANPGSLSGRATHVSQATRQTRPTCRRPRVGRAARQGDSGH